MQAMQQSGAFGGPQGMESLLDIFGGGGLGNGLGGGPPPNGSAQQNGSNGNGQFNPSPSQMPAETGAGPPASNFHLPPGLGGPGGGQAPQQGQGQGQQLQGVQLENTLSKLESALSALQQQGLQPPPAVSRPRLRLESATRSLPPPLISASSPPCAGIPTVLRRMLTAPTQVRPPWTTFRAWPPKLALSRKRIHRRDRVHSSSSSFFHVGVARPTTSSSVMLFLRPL